MIKCLLPIHGLRLPAKWWCRSSQPSLSSNTMWGMRKMGIANNSSDGRGRRHSRCCWNVIESARGFRSGDGHAQCVQTQFTSVSSSALYCQVPITRMCVQNGRVSRKIEKNWVIVRQITSWKHCPLALKAFPGFALAIPEYFMILQFECPVSEICLPSEKWNLES